MPDVAPLSYRLTGTCTGPEICKLVFNLPLTLSVLQGKNSGEVGSLFFTSTSNALKMADVIELMMIFVGMHSVRATPQELANLRAEATDAVKKKDCEFLEQVNVMTITIACQPGGSLLKSMSIERTD
jgi:hypothetical protein